MFASLQYIQARHPYGEIPGQPSQAPQPATPNSAVPTSAVSLPNGDAFQSRQDGSETPPPVPQDQFDRALREMAQDLVIKEQQIEIVINSLPGIGSSETDQEKRMRELESELREVEKERAKAEEEKEKMVDMLGQVIVGARRVP